MKSMAQTNEYSTRMNRKARLKLWRYWDLYLMVLPGILFLAVYKYAPMYGIVIAFKDYNIIQGVFNSPWVGLQYFRELFMFNEFPRVLRNTILISLMKLVVGFPAPILLALLIYELRRMRFKRFIQTVTYLPHFISWVVIGGIVIDLLSPSSGIVNRIITGMGYEPVFFMTSSGMFRWILVFSDVWKEMGWGAILYLAALVGINDELFHAATVDGAGKLRQVWHISIPGIRPTIVILLLLRIGHLLSAGFEQVLVMYNPAVYDVGDIIDTYVFRVGLGTLQFSLTTAAGLFQSAVGCVLLVMANWLARRLGEEGIF